MEQLNLPQPSDLKIDLSDDSRGRIYDPLRQRWVALTPEEWVRQNFTSWLISYRNYPRSLMANEVGIRLQGMLRRIDTLVYSRDGKTPLCIVEYKSPDVTLSASTFRQAARYNIVMHAPLLIISNGLRHLCAVVTKGNPEPIYLKDIPTYEALLALSEKLRAQTGSTSG